MKLLKQAGTAAVASALLLSIAPQAWAAPAAAPVAVSATAAAGTAASMPAAANGTQTKVNIGKEKALELIQTYITIPADFKLQSANLNDYPDATGRVPAIWNFSYVRQIDDQYLGDIYVSIDAMNGRLLDYRYNNNDPAQKPTYPPKISYKDAKAIADTWIARINPQQKDHVRYNVRQEEQTLTPLNSYQQYDVRFDRVENGVPFASDGVTVTVNGSGDVTGYSFHWDDEVKFESAGDLLGLDKTAALFREKARVVPVYQTPYDAKDPSKLYVAYTMDTLALKAVSGELWGQSAGVAAAGYDKPLSDKPLGEKPTDGKKLSKEEALAKVTAAFPIPAGYKLTNASYSEYPSGYSDATEMVWNFSWTEPEDSNDKQSKRIAVDSVMASVNAGTGEVTGYTNFKGYWSDADHPVVANVSLESAEQKAMDAVKKFAPYYADQLVLEAPMQQELDTETLKQTRNWSFTFQRVIDGVLAGYESVNVAIDRETGELVSYSNGLSGREYPAQKPKLLPIEEAKELLFSQYDIELGYIVADSFNRPMVKGGIAEQKLNLMIASGELPPGGSGDGGHEAKLVYSLVPKYVHDSFFLDAETGEWRDAANGEPITLEKPQATDIEGHWAQSELQLMLDYRALDVVDGKVSPNAAITKGELIKMLVIAINGGRTGIQYSSDRAASFADVKAGSPYFAYVENAVDRGLLDPGKAFNPQAHMTREEVASLIVKALGYKELAGYPAIFNDRFADASELGSLGEVAIVTGLGIMSLTDGRFNGKQEVTRAQAATAFYRFLEKRAELGDQRPPIYM
ncbi:S-layer homology domain-containing protein [Paenibacillus athensensis]|uniref:S-layer homology domain-containing protein n=1 Tax=Paenibacillus athensensis TaxID=1967502 RepID=UPI001431FD46|nr:S-layer homology domain-containing protein [Paenibacillus athensensis]MCD1260057.1 S-layer homology domain-containing protein [Paenibacillus athensensis]